EHANVAAGAEAAAFAMIDDHRRDGIVIAPLQKRVDHRFAHGEVERVDRLGAIERDAADPHFCRDQNVFGHKPSQNLLPSGEGYGALPLKAVRRSWMRVAPSRLCATIETLT